MSNAAHTPAVSVLIPTYNRARLLAESLESLVQQTLSKSRFEVIVVDDGSSDDTAAVCRRYAARMDVRYFRIGHAGISSAKNLGVFTSRAPILVFFDDDDVADAGLLRAHLDAHERHPDEATAILGYTAWSPLLKVTPVMHYIMDMGCFLFSYGRLKDGQKLDYTYFWGGRSSCKRALLVKHGVFRQDFQFGSEDIELGYRLSRLGLKVVYTRQAVQYMNRPITYDEFCRRCEKQGISQHLFGQVHSDPTIQEYCQLIDVEEKWAEVRDSLPAHVRRVHEIEASHQAGEAASELHTLYGLTFNGFKLKGIAGARQLGDSAMAYRTAENAKAPPVPILSRH